MLNTPVLEWRMGHNDIFSVAPGRALGILNYQYHILFLTIGQVYKWYKLISWLSWLSLLSWRPEGLRAFHHIIFSLINYLTNQLNQLPSLCNSSIRKIFSHNCGNKFHFLLPKVKKSNSYRRLIIYWQPFYWHQIQKNGINFHRMRHSLSYLTVFKLKIPTYGTQFAKTLKCQL